MAPDESKVKTEGARDAGQAGEEGGQEGQEGAEGALGVGCAKGSGGSGGEGVARAAVVAREARRTGGASPPLYSKAISKCRRRSVFLGVALTPAPPGELAAVCGMNMAPSPMYGRYGNICRYIVGIPMHRARSKCRSRVRVLAPVTEQVPVFFRKSVYRLYDAVSGLYRLAIASAAALQV